MASNVYKEKTHKMDRQALRFFGIMSAVIYLSALIYCFGTGHFFEVGLLGVIMLGLAVFVIWAFKKN